MVALGLQLCEVLFIGHAMSLRFIPVAVKLPRFAQKDQDAVVLFAMVHALSLPVGAECVKPCVAWVFARKMALTGQRTGGSIRGPEIKEEMSLHLIRNNA